MGNYVVNPYTLKTSEQGQGIDFSWGSSRMQGYRCNMLDFTLNEPKLGHLNTFSLFLVFDGHGNADCSWNTAQQFAKFLSTQGLLQELKDDTIYDKEAIKEILKRTIMTYDKELEKIVRKELRSGTTASGILITSNHLFIINLGDSRTILCRNREIMFETVDHDTKNSSERERIYKAGGFIKSTYVNGAVNITRSLGNYDLKQSPASEENQQIISVEPDITVIDRNRNEDDFIVILTDGLTRKDGLTSQQIIEYIIKRYPAKQSEKDLCEELMDYTLNQGAKDNMAITIIKFDNSTLKRENQMIKNDLELNEKIIEATRIHTQNIITNNIYRRLSTSLQEIQDNNQELFLEEATQGYGFKLKKPMIEAEIGRLKAENRRKVRAELCRQWDEEKAKREDNKN